jgi:hypothetical protein
MKKLVLYFAILSVSLCVPALSYAVVVPVMDNYSGTVSAFHGRFTFVDQGTGKLKTVALNATAPRGIKNAEISRDTTNNTIGPYNAPLTQNDHGVVLMQPSLAALTSSAGVTMSNVQLVFYFWDGTAKFDVNTYTASGTGNIYACLAGGTLTFIPAGGGTKGVMKITNITPAETIYVNVVGGVEGTAMPAVATITLPAVTFVKVTP